MNPVVLRGLASVLALACYGAGVAVYAPNATVSSALTAARQLDNSDAVFIQSSTWLSLLSGINGVMSLILILALIAIWWGAVRRQFAMLAGLAAMLTVPAPAPALAFADTVDKTEVYTILPNESAFWIPDVGANKDSQGLFDSEAYLQERKIAVKRFVIPHQKLAGSGGTALMSGWDFFVPTGRLIIVDRTPFSREWVAQHDRGTSSKNEAFPCQSKEGLNISVGVSVGTSVLEANAAKYLYRFGVLSAQGERTDPRVIFTSVYYSRKLADVMDDVGRKKVQTLVCDEITSRAFDKVNEDAVDIMKAVKKNATDYFASVGITLDFVGWADTFTFDKDIQEALNRRYIASKDLEIATALAPHTATIQALAAAHALRAFGEKSDGRLPTTIVGLPTDVSSLMSGLLKAPSAAAVTAPKPQQ